ncbi:MAG: gliding motility protein GldM [Bacteroidetes bacterium]|nr:MAG: gliding motility protein GldM [Bacteroidota bacterium]TAG90436.1 MAG: gliding motility protein GldM [Bacteroidota bacterium]
MAGGGKQTPRQRMINMMYLVLTAMLALQVSSSIIDKFIFLNDSLERALGFSRQASENALKKFEEKVKKEGNSADGQRAIKRAHELKQKTSDLISYIDKLKTRLEKEAGGGREHGVIKDPKEETKVELIMLGATKNGEGYTLGKKLDAYTTALASEYADLGLSKNDFPSLAMGNEKNKIYEHDQIQKNKGFAEANFGQTPVVAAMAVLTQKQNEIIRYEQEVLKKLVSGDMSSELKFDKIRAVATADANIVALGSEYKAEMYITASSSKSGASMTYNGSSVRVDPDGVGEVKFTASGKGEQSWKGTITIKQRGKDTTFTFTKKFEVVEPVLIVKAEANFPLYRNCANPLETAVPALGASYKPSFSVTNGTAIPGARAGSVTIFPGAGPSSKLTVTSSGKVAGTADFRIMPVPPPDVFIANTSGGKINVKDPIPMPPTLRIAAKSDETFYNTLPKEANFQVMQFTVTQFRGGRGITNQVVNGSQFSTGSLSTRPGDGIQIQVTSVIRINSRGEKEQSPINAAFHSFFIK